MGGYLRLLFLLKHPQVMENGMLAYTLYHETAFFVKVEKAQKVFFV
jgi:hypothetical protein